MVSGRQTLPPLQAPRQDSADFGGEKGASPEYVQGRLEAGMGGWSGKVHDRQPAREQEVGGVVASHMCQRHSERQQPVAELSWKNRVLQRGLAGFQTAMGQWAPALHNTQRSAVQCSVAWHLRRGRTRTWSNPPPRRSATPGCAPREVMSRLARAQKKSSRIPRSSSSGASPEPDGTSGRIRAAPGSPYSAADCGRRYPPLSEAPISCAPRRMVAVPKNPQ